MGLSDDLDDPTKFLFALGTEISANDFLVVSAGLLADNAVLSTEFGLSGSGDAVYLFAADGTLIDSVVFGFQATDFSIGRYRDQWIASVPTLGATNMRSPTTSPMSTRINEWLASATHRFGEDYLELLNPGRYPIVLEGMSLTDDVTYEPDKFMFPALSFLTPGGFLALDQSDLSFSLARDSEEFALLDTDGELVDGVSIVNAAGEHGLRSRA